jgi:hypothetical protein
MRVLAYVAENQLAGSPNIKRIVPIESPDALRTTIDGQGVIGVLVENQHIAIDAYDRAFITQPRFFSLVGNRYLDTALVAKNLDRHSLILTINGKVHQIFGNSHIP